MKSRTAMLGDIDFRYWAVFAATAIYISMKNAEREQIKHRLAKVLVNGLLAWGLGRDLSLYLWNSEIAAAVVLMSCGWIALDAITAVIADPKLISDVVRARLGLDKEDGK